LSVRSYNQRRVRPTDARPGAFYSGGTVNNLEILMKALVALALALSGAVIATAAPSPELQVPFADE